MKELKMNEEGRSVLRENFWSCFFKLFAKGDAEAIETLLYHEIVDVRQEMTRVNDFWFRIYILKLKPVLS